MSDENAESEAEGFTETREGKWKARAIIGLIVVVVAVVSWMIGAAVLPRWWAQRIGDIVDGRLTLGSLLGVVIGFVFTLFALTVLAVGWRVRSGWKRALATVALAAVVAAPNLMTLGIVFGDGNAAHAGERILDVDGPGFRGGSLVGAIFGVVAAGFVGFLSISRRRNKRKVADLKAEMKS